MSFHEFGRRDLRHRFHVNRRAYVVDICGCDDHPVAVPVTTSNTYLHLRP